MLLSNVKSDGNLVVGGSCMSLQLQVTGRYTMA